MIYLDSAATTLLKPTSVPRAVANAIRTCASPGRGGHHPGNLAGDILYRCRERAAGIFHVRSPEQIVLTANATHGLNIAIHSLVHAGDTVLISGYEHNAVTRTLKARKDIRVNVAAGALFDPEDVYSKFKQGLDDGADVVICTHVSNVFGFIQPIERIAELCRSYRKPLIVDCAQSAGVLPIDFEAWGAAFAAMPGNKGLLGPQGTGLLLCGEDCVPLICGGTGGSSREQDMPAYLPDRLEAGTQNVCGAAGLLAGMDYLHRIGIGRLDTYERRLCGRMMERLGRDPNIRVFRGDGCQTGVFSMTVSGVDHEELGTELGRRGVAVRAGLHCAPLAHKSAGTLDRGTVRASFSPFLTDSQTDAAAAIIEQTVHSMRAR